MGLAEWLLAQATEQGVSLVGPGGLSNQLTKNVLGTALEAELTEYLGYEHGQRPVAENLHNGTRVKTVLTKIGLSGDRGVLGISVGFSSCRSWSTTWRSGG